MQLTNYKGGRGMHHASPAAASVRKCSRPTDFFTYSAFKITSKIDCQVCRSVQLSGVGVFAPNTRYLPYRQLLDQPLGITKKNC